MMDKRCIRSLKDYPDSPCYLAVMRLKQLRAADHDLTEAEEAKLSGCPWALNSQCANYCFFSYCAKIADGNLSDIEIASMLNMSTEAVRKTEKEGLNKLRNSPEVKEIKAIYRDEKIIDDAMDESIHEVSRSK